MIVFIMELSLFSIHKIFKVKYFENIYESKLRYGHFDIYLDLKNKKNEILENPKKKKLAIFGGSSSKGFGVNYSFYDLLKYTLNENYIVHNYSLNEASFYNNQYLILEKVIKYYDKVLIYAGHNEIYPFLIDKKKYINLPSGGTIGPEDYYNYRNYYLAAVNQIFLDKMNFISFEFFKINFLNNSRIFNIFQKINFFLKKDLDLVSSNRKYSNVYFTITKFGKNTNKNIINKIDKEIITNNFINNIVNLKKNYPNQQIIISEVLSNYFFPPFSNYLDIDNDEELINLEKKYLNLYKEIKFKKNYLDLKYKSSHEYTINSLICLKQNKNFLRICHDFGIISNQKDNFPLRVIPSLNKKIRSLNSEDFSIIQISNKLKKTESFEDFNSFFIDFQHPSEKGHLMIANEVLKSLNLPKIKNNSENKCISLKFFFKDKQILIPQKYSDEELKEMKLIFLSNFYENSIIKKPISFFINDAKSRKKCKSKN